MMTTTIPSADWKLSADIFSIITSESARHVITRLLKDRKLTAVEIAGDGFTRDRCQDAIRKLESIGLIRRERFGNEVSYTLNYDRFDNINLSAGLLLGTWKPDGFPTAADRR